jgi:SSS family solute:Na+ symporter
MEMRLGAIDYGILALYFLFVLGIGVLIRRRVRSSEDFLTAHRSVPVWITSLAFIAANLGAQWSACVRRARNTG